MRKHCWSPYCCVQGEENEPRPSTYWCYTLQSGWCGHLRCLSMCANWLLLPDYLQ